VSRTVSGPCVSFEFPLNISSIAIAWGFCLYSRTGAVGFTAAGLGGVCDGVSVLVVSRRCLGGVAGLLVVSRRCLSSVSVVSWWSLGGVSVVSWSCLGGRALVVSAWAVPS
jgi:hypothetical protein